MNTIELPIDADGNSLAVGDEVRARYKKEIARLVNAGVLEEEQNDTLPRVL